MTMLDVTLLTGLVMLTEMIGGAAGEAASLILARIWLGAGGLNVALTVMS